MFQPLDNQDLPGVRSHPVSRGSDPLAAAVSAALACLQQKGPEELQLARVASGLPPCDWRHLVLAMGEEMAWNSAFRGADPNATCQTYKAILESWKAGKGRFSTSKMTPKLASELLETLDRCLDLMLQKSSSVAQLKEKLTRQLEQQPIIYLPLCIHGEKGGASHGVSLRIEKRGSLLLLSILNLGAGVENHPILDKKTTHEQRSYRSFTFEVSEEELLRSAKGDALLSKLIGYCTQSAPYGAYSVSEVYDILRFVCEEKPELGEAEELLRMPCQSAPNCGELIWRLVMRDRLVSCLEGAERKREIDKIFLEFRLVLLLSAYQAEADSAELLAFQHALQTFAFDVSENLDLFSKAEQLHWTRMLHQMEDKRAISTVVATQLTAIADPLAAFTVELAEEQVTRETLAKEEPAPHLVMPKSQAPTLLQKIQDWTDYLRSASGQTASCFAKQLSLLPIPKFNEEDFWDKIPSKDISATVTALIDFMQVGLRGVDLKRGAPELPFSAVFIAVHQIYAIVDKLVRRQSHQLERYGSPFLLENGQTFELLPHQQKQYHALATYFKKTQEQNRGALFPAAPQLSVEEAISQMDNSGPENRLQFHLHYLGQLGISRKQQNLCSCLPKEVQQLYYLAALAQMLLPNSGFGNLGVLPTELTFKVIEDSNSLIALEFMAEYHDLEDQGNAMTAPYPWLYKSLTSYYPAGLSENGAMAARPPQEIVPLLSADTFRELLALSLNQELRLSATIHWLSSHYSEWDKGIVQSELLRALLAPGKLAAAAEADPEILSKLQTLFLRVYQAHGRNCSSQLTTFLCNCSLIVAALQPPLARKSRFIEQLLLHDEVTKTETLLYLHWIGLKGQIRDTEEACKVASYLLLGDEEIHYQTRGLFWENRHEIREIGHGLLIDYLRSHIADPDVQTLLQKYAMALFGCAELDWGQIATKFGLSMGRRLHLSPTFAEIQHGGKLHGLFFGSPDLLSTADGMFSIHTTAEGRRTLSRQFTLAGTVRNAFLVRLRWPDHHKLEQYDFYREGETLYGFSRGETPSLKIEMKNGKWLLTSCQAKDPKKGEIVDLGSPQSRFASLAQRIYFPHLVICTVSGAQTVALEFTDLDLAFQQGKCSRFPGFALLESEVWDHYPDALVLQNQSGQRKLILPIRPLSRRGSRLGAEVYPQPKLISPNKRYALFTIDPHTQLLQSADPEAYIYLALLYRMRCNYELARHYLRQVRTIESLTEFANGVLPSFCALQDRSNESLDIDMQIVSLLCANERVMRESQFTPHKQQLSQEMLFWMAGRYESYLSTYAGDIEHVRGDQKCSRIPLALRLPAAEEAVVARYLFDRLDKADPSYELIKARFAFLCSPSGSVDVTIKPYPLYHLPDSFRNRLVKPEMLAGCKVPHSTVGKRLDPDIFPPRYEIGAAATHFADFYERARSGDPLFVFHLHALFEGRESRTGDKQVLASLLFYVYYFPQAYTDLPPTILQVKERTVQFFSNAAHSAELTALLEKQRAEFQVDHPSHRLRFPEQIEERLIPLSLPESCGDVESHVPLQLLCNQLFERQIVQIPKPEIAPSINDPELREAYGRLATYHRPCYRLRPNAPIAEVAHALERQKKILHAELQGQRRALIEQLNTPPEVDLERFVLEHTAGQTLSLLPEMVMQEVILRGNLALLATHRPHFREVSSLLAATKEYYHNLAIYGLMVDALRYLEAKRWNLLAETLDYRFQYDPTLYPEISHHAVVSGMRPTKEQLEIYQKICAEMERGNGLTVQLPGGFGKTSFLRPLIIRRVLMMRLLPVMMTPEQCYSVDLANLMGTWVRQGGSLQIFELKLSHTPNADEYKQMLVNIKDCHQKGGALVMTPETYHALQIHAQKSGLQAIGRQSYFIHQILEYLQQHGVLLMDEEHQTAAPTTTAKMALDRPVHLDRESFEWLSQIMLDLCLPSNQREKQPHMSIIAEVARLRSFPRQQKSLTAGEIATVARALLAIQRIDGKLPDLPDAFYLEAPLSGSLNIEKKAAVARHFFLTLLPEIFNKRLQKDHRGSLFNEQDIQVPAESGVASHAQFRDPYLAAVLSIKAVLLEGFNEERTVRFISHLRRKIVEEAEFGGYLTLAVAELKKTVPLLASLEAIDFSSVEMMKPLMEQLNLSNRALILYLHELVFPQIWYGTKEVGTTATRMIRGFRNYLGFSATPGIAHPGSRLMAPDFEAHVLATICLPKNAEVEQAIPNPASIFSNPKVNVILDPGGFFIQAQDEDSPCSFSLQSLADIWMLCNPRLKAVVSFDRDGITCIKKGGEELHFPGSHDLREQLAIHGMDWDSDPIALFFDRQYCVAADLPTCSRPLCARFMLTDGIDFGQVCQTLLRMRDFLNPAASCSVIWHLAPGMASLLPKSSPEGIFAYTSQLKQRREASQASFAGFHSLQELVLARFNEQKRAILNSAQSIEQKMGLLGALYARHGKGLIREIERDVVQLFCQQSRELPIQDVMMPYFHSLYEALYGERPSADEVKQLCKCVQDTSRYVKQLEESFVGDSEGVVQVQQENQLTPPDEVFAIPDLGSGEAVDFGDRGVLEKMIEQGSLIAASQFFMLEEGPGATYVTSNFVTTTERQWSGEARQERSMLFIKPVSQFVIFVRALQGSSPHYTALPHCECLAFIAAQEECVAIKNCIEQESDQLQLPHQAMLVSILGNIDTRGVGAWRISSEQEQAILQSDWLRNLRIDLLLQNGVIPTEEMHGISELQLLERMMHYNDPKRVLSRSLARQFNGERAERMRGPFQLLLGRLEAFKKQIQDKQT